MKSGWSLKVGLVVSIVLLLSLASAWPVRATAETELEREIKKLAEKYGGMTGAKTGKMAAKEGIVGDATMIQIEAEVVEVNITKCLEMGIEWPAKIGLTELTPTVGTQLASGVIANPPLYTGSPPEVMNPVPIYPKNPDHITSQVIRRLDGLKAELKMLDDKGVARTLAKPKLLTKSQTSASFQVGGEIPIPIGQGMGAVSIEYKKYGITLDIKPSITKKRRIDAQIKAEVSALDYANAVTLSGTEVPALSTRTATSQVNIADGETVVIAGLRHTKKEKTYWGIPGLCRIPWVGMLFGRQKWIDSVTTVFIFVTPTIVN